MRSAMHYLAAVFIIWIFIKEASPRISEAASFWLPLKLTVWFLIAYMVRIFLIGRYVEKAEFEVQVRRQLIIELALYLFIGFLMGLHSFLQHKLPLENIFAFLPGCLVLGYFESVDLALERERKVINHIAATNGEIPIDDRLLPVTRKFAFMAVITAVITTWMILRVVEVDLEWIVASPEGDLNKKVHEIMIEIEIIVTIMLIELINIVISYSSNLKLIIKNQNSALKEVADGNLESHVAVATKDEFGVMAKYTNLMIECLKSRTDELLQTQDVTILAMASLAETRDPETGAHILRTQRYVRALALNLKSHPDYKDYLQEEIIELLFKSAPLHDVGKVGIPDYILLKPARLSDDEYEIMKTHTTLGRDALLVAEEKLGSNSFLRLAREIAYSHHEKWDGSGYPRGLAGKDIPKSGRLMALADVYDALVNERVYKPAFSHEKAKQIILEKRGEHFDPLIVDAFLEIEREFIEIAGKYRDAEDVEAA